MNPEFFVGSLDMSQVQFQVTNIVLKIYSHNYNKSNIIIMAIINSTIACIVYLHCHMFSINNMNVAKDYV